MQVFISSSVRSKKWAEKLAEELRGTGISSWLDTAALLPGTHWRQTMEEMLHASKYVVTLFDSSGDVDPVQRRTITEVLNAMWEEGGKRLIPILLRDARLPDFMHSAVSQAGVHAIRVSDPRVEWKDASTKVANLIREDKNLANVDLGEVIQLGEKHKQDQAQRLSYIEAFAQSLKSGE
jgi:hypothetical protein